MRKALRSGILLVLLPVALLACATGYALYSENLFQGKRLLERGDYANAVLCLREATQHWKDGQVFAFLGTAEYKDGQVEQAMEDLEESARLDPYGYWYLRVLGYEALTLLKRGATGPGLEALDLYIALYRTRDPLPSIETVELMASRGVVDLPLLEQLVEQQASWYEDDVERYRTTRTGFYDRFSGFR